MSRILFLCSGNTCRSPMATAIARRIFGQSHTIVGAGAETENGLPAARNAVIAMSKLGLDISSHSSADVAGIDLEQFDLIVVFRPSAAEAIDVPASCRVEYLDIADPYGGSLERYHLTARLIEHSVRRLYAEDSLRRISEGSATGSHAAGIFNRAAKEFEKEAFHFATKHLGVSLHKKATLGKVAEAIEQHSALRDAPQLASLAVLVTDVNEKWVSVKHRDDPPAEVLVSALSSIIEGSRLLQP
jgi:protein-tyrosine-phosphatase